ncbi:MAG: extracellular solute-binding protein [uncultured bacterium]|nr:MAG: extracellular solute-binding protein [uncultured bacterium]
MATILKEDLSKVGIEMNIERMEWATFLGKIEKREFEATSLGWSTGFESDPYQLWHSSQAHVERGSNFVGFENAEVDKILEDARVEFDTEKRNTLYRRFQEIVYEEQPYTFLFSSYSLVAVNKRFDNVIVHKTGLDTTEWKLKIN